MTPSSSPYATLASADVVEATIKALKDNGMEAFVVGSGPAAKQKVLDLLPSGAEVMDMTSMTLEAISVASELADSDSYAPVRKRLGVLNEKTEVSQKQKLGAAPDWVVGSVHAVTESGQVVVASNTGSQLPAYAYGAQHVIWVVGTHKIVTDLDAAMRRVYEHSLPLESERAKKAYGVPGSSVNKLLIINKEVTPGRITVIFVNEALGF